MRSLLLAVPLVLASLAGCKKHVTDCGDVADNMIVVTRDVVAKTGNPPPKKDALVAECKSRKLDSKEMACMAAAKDVEGLANCVGKRVQEPRDKSGHAADAPQPDLSKLPPGHPQVDKAMSDPRMGSGAGPSGGSAAAPAAGSGSAK
ncbi:MAG TPA: hypothetical protein VGM90_16670 [Kofleriaceae bacterium]|jgi:hypothetical protein